MSKSNKSSLAYAFSQALNLGIIMVSTIVVGLLIGRGLDAVLGTYPAFSIGGIVLGIVSGCYGVFKQILQIK